MSSPSAGSNWPTIALTGTDGAGSSAAKSYFAQECRYAPNASRVEDATEKATIWSIQVFDCRLPVVKSMIA